MTPLIAQVKEYLFVKKKEIKRTIEKVIASHFRYSAEDYPHSFTSYYTSDISDQLHPVKIERVIYVFWTGNNEMSENRRKCLESLISDSGVTVKLIDTSNLMDYIKSDDPLPECFQYLSFVHKADYLRTYFMHHYGGGYSDIKMCRGSWIQAFERLEKSDMYICGYREGGPKSVASPQDAETHTALRRNWSILPGNCSYICRPHTKLTDEWYRETRSRVLRNSDSLREHPSGDPYGTNSDYPIPWTYILGDVFHPVCLKYHNKVMFDEVIRYLPSEYR